MYYRGDRIWFRWRDEAGKWWGKPTPFNRGQEAEAAAFAAAFPSSQRGRRIADARRRMAAAAARRVDKSASRYLYAIATASAVKLGRAVNPAERLIKLQGSCPEPLCLVAYADCGELERLVHQELSSHRVLPAVTNHEWFDGVVLTKIVRLVGYVDGDQPAGPSATFEGWLRDLVEGKWLKTWGRQ